MTKRDPKTRFLLIQGGSILGVATGPDNLLYSAIDGTCDFDVAIGCINEFGKPEVVSIIASARPMADATHIRVISLIDGSNRMVGFGTSITSLIRTRLNSYFSSGYFDDLLQLPDTIVIRGAK